MIHFVLLTGLVMLLVIFQMVTPVTQVRAERGAQPAFEDTPAYSAPATTTPENNRGYPPPSQNTALPTLSSGKTATPGLPVDTVTVTATITKSPNIFQTENSEMNNARVTPALTDTPGPSITPYISPTATQTISASDAQGKKSGLAMDWGLFWVGFSVPVLAGCGMVLYLLDHSPELFRKRR